MRTSLPTWLHGGGVVVDVRPEPADWKLPSDAVKLSAFHITLLGRKVFTGREDAMAAIWDVVQSALPLPPQSQLGARVNVQTEGDRKTWFLDVVNQEDYRSYVEQLLEKFNRELQARGEKGFEQLPADRYFHMTVANNCGGDPMKSIGSIRPSSGAAKSKRPKSSSSTR